MSSLYSTLFIYLYFWNEAKKFITEDLGVAVDDGCHCEVSHLAKAISIREYSVNKWLAGVSRTHPYLVKDCSSYLRQRMLFPQSNIQGN